MMICWRDVKDGVVRRLFENFRDPLKKEKGGGEIVMLNAPAPDESYMQSLKTPPRGTWQHISHREASPFHVF